MSGPVNWNAVEREECAIEEALDNGEITNDEYRRQMRDLHDDARGIAEEAAEEAYRDAMGDW